MDIKKNEILKVGSYIHHIEIIFYMRNILFIYFILINILYSNIKNNFFYINSLEFIFFISLKKNKKYE
ncbi:hypothetical protein PFFVO_03584 [Plasmodium falciparum Vietnam Oak-Knoll (FVO)]|uniref:Uncharacterized protein n=1 Tax=Plasmodium falciparum Vietnam Oak-Knoll (FVO) TaxID=1036723 RepID=A0A024V343_PLAFA|nr:hypothetical protein PFFVO_03584 [Plasmodium falciparum Vietnam Oak-Knoll (FVO)]